MKWQETIGIVVCVMGFMLTNLYIWYKVFEYVRYYARQHRSERVNQAVTDYYALRTNEQPAN